MTCRGALWQLQRETREPFAGPGARAGPGISNALLGVLVVMGAIGSAATWVAVRNSPVLVDPEADAVIRALYVACYFAVGLYTWRQRPGRLLGPLLLAVGIVQALEVLDATGDPVAFTFGRLMNVATQVLLVYLFVSFPRDHPRPGFDRRFVLIYLVGTSVIWACLVVVARTLPCGRCRDRLRATMP